VSYDHALHTTYHHHSLVFIGL